MKTFYPIFLVLFFLMTAVHSRAQTITKQPSDTSACIGDNLTPAFTVETQEDPATLEFQWYLDGSAISDSDPSYMGATDNELTIYNIDENNEGEYKCKITNPSTGKTVYTNAVYFYLKNPVIIEDPYDAYVCVGSDVSLTVKVENPYILYTFEWYNDNNVKIMTESAYSSSSLDMNDITKTQGGYYHCVVSTNACSSDNSVNSASAYVGVYDSVFITDISPDTSLCQNQSLTLQASARGDNPNFQWVKNGNPIPGQNSPTLTFSSLGGSDDAYYACRVSNICNQDVSDNVLVHVIIPPQISSQSQSQSVCEGHNITLTVNTEGTDLSFQWVKDGNELGMENTSTLVINNFTQNDEGTYQCQVYNDCDTVNSSPIILTFKPGVHIISGPQDTVIYNNHTAVFTVKATGDNLSYQWQKDGLDLTDEPSHIQGTNDDTLYITVQGAEDQGLYRCIVSNTCNSDITNNARLSLVTTEVSHYASKNFSIYPNPSNGQFTVHTPQRCKIYIFNTAGQLVFVKKLNSPKQTISLNLPPGVYNVKFTAREFSHIQKLIIK